MLGSGNVGCFIYLYIHPSFSLSLHPVCIGHGANWAARVTAVWRPVPPACDGCLGHRLSLRATEMRKFRHIRFRRKHAFLIRSRCRR